jgi:hypothetical protein
LLKNRKLGHETVEDGGEDYTTLNLKCLNRSNGAVFGKGSCEIVVFEKSHIKISIFHYDSKSDQWETGKICTWDYNLRWGTNKFIPDTFLVKFEVCRRYPYYQGKTLEQVRNYSGISIPI